MIWYVVISVWWFSRGMNKHIRTRRWYHGVWAMQTSLRVANGWSCHADIELNHCHHPVKTRQVVLVNRTANQIWLACEGSCIHSYKFKRARQLFRCSGRSVGRRTHGCWGTRQMKYSRQRSHPNAVTATWRLDLWCVNMCIYIYMYICIHIYT